MAVDQPKSPIYRRPRRPAIRLARIRTSLQGTVGTRHNRLIRSHSTGGLQLAYGVLLSTESYLCGKNTPACLLNPLINYPSAPHLHHFEMNVQDRCY